MGSFGDKLKREREMRAITLEEIAEATKIGTRSLKALEDEHFDQLPGGIFNKGFVRAYARFLGLDEEQAVADYMAASNEVGNSTAMQLKALADEAERVRATNEAAKQSNTGSMIAVLIAIVLLSAIGFGAWKAYQFKKQQAAAEAAAAAAPRRRAPPPVALQTSPEQTTSTTPGGTSPTSPVTQPTGTLPGIPATAAQSAAPQSPVSSGSSTTTPQSTTPATPTTAPSTNANKPPVATSAGASATDKTKSNYQVTVGLKVVKPSWIDVKSDGKQVFSATIGPNEGKRGELSFQANERINLIIGNAAGVELTVNGKPAGPLGEDGKTRNLTITPQGIQR